MNTQAKTIATIALLSTALTGCCLGGDKCKPPKDAQPDAKYTHLDGSIKRESQRELFIHQLGEENGYSGSIDFSETSKNQGFQYTKLIHNGKLSESLNSDSQIEITTEDNQSPIVLIGDKGKNGDIIDITLIPKFPLSKYRNTFFTKGYADVSFTPNRVHIEVHGICNGTQNCDSIFGVNLNEIKTPIYNGMPIPVPEEARPLLNYKGQPIDYVNGFISNRLLFDITYNKFTEEFKTPENLLLQALHIRAKTEIKNVILWDRENDLVFRFPVYNTVDNIYVPELPTDFILPKGSYIIDVEDLFNKTIEGNSSGDTFRVESMLLFNQDKQNIYLYSRQDD